jgi:hypothetical protein
MGEACSTYWERRGAYTILVVRTEGRKLLGRPRRRREDNIKIDIQAVGWGIYWIQLAEDRET